MKATPRPSLRSLNTMGVEASAAYLVSLKREEDLLALPAFDPNQDLILGGGSNVLIASDVPGTVFHNRLLGKSIVDRARGHAWIEVGAGENWHSLVRWTLDEGLSGLENLSLIPGCAGAAPIQNIGAYGVELAAVLDSVTAWDLVNSQWIVFNLADCGLTYRDSVFKSGDPNRFLICSIRLKLDTQFTPNLNYAGLQDELAQMNTRNPSAIDVSNAVIRLRQRKLPDPGKIGNAGSFFKNPVLAEKQANMLSKQFPALPSWSAGENTMKYSAAWMIEHCGLKGFRMGQAGVSEQHALVLVNTGSATGKEILELANHVQTTVHNTFGVQLEPEPRIINLSP